MYKSLFSHILPKYNNISQSDNKIILKLYYLMSDLTVYNNYIGDKAKGSHN